MSNVCLPLAYLPPADWFMALLSGDAIWIDAASPYRKQSYLNRTYIMSANGLLPLSIPVHAGTMHHPVNEVLIDYTKPWRRVHWRAIESAYNRSPFFLYYRDIIECRYYGPEVLSLREWNLLMIHDMLKLLRTEKEISLLEGKGENRMDDYLDLSRAFHPKHPHKFSSDYYEPYRQVFIERFGFQHHLSVLDILCNLGPEALDYLKRHSQNARLR